MPANQVEDLYAGAATLSLRKFVGSALRLSRFIALQWGRNFIVAEISNGDIVHIVGEALQWGRNFIVAEIKIVEETTKDMDAASMGPQLYRCGNHFLLINKINHLIASMGPQLYRCGNDRRGLCSKDQLGRFNGAATLSLRKCSNPISTLTPNNLLQWGRNFIVAEMIRGGRGISVGHDMLQWGRNFIVAEIRFERRYRKEGDQLQWGRNFIVAEMAPWGR